jgi:hypothetical protein
MNKLSISTVIAIAISTAIGFTCGYVFYASYGEARSAAVQAVLAVQTTERVLQGYQPILITSRFYDELKAARTPQELETLRQKYRDSTLRNISSFERQAGKFELPSERALAEPFLRDAAKIRRSLELENSVTGLH